MRDIALTIVVLGLIPFVLKRPVYGVLLWVWLGVMNPHRLAFGFAYNFPFAQIVAIATFVGIVLTRDPKRLVVTPPVVLLLLLVAWMNVTTLFALNPIGADLQWDKVMKIQLMVFVALYLLHTRQHVHWLVWVLVVSVAYYGLKGGRFTLLTGGGQKVLGPAGSYIEENNALAVGILMTIPLLRYLQLQVTKRWQSIAFLGVICLCGISVLGSQSRGALVATAASVGFLWIKSRNKLITGILLACFVPMGIAFMPDTWDKRMRTMETYEEDVSAMGRINAWKMAMNLAEDRPIVGGGFEAFTKSVAIVYAPSGTAEGYQGAHSIYFQMLGEHGYVGLVLFVLLWIGVWFDARWVIKAVRKRAEWRWAEDLARMIQVSLISYGVGGAFLNLAYWDVPYYLLVLMSVTRALIAKEARENAPAGFRRPQGSTEAPPRTDAAPGVVPAAGSARGADSRIRLSRR